MPITVSYDSTWLILLTLDKKSMPLGRGCTFEDYSFSLEELTISHMSFDIEVREVKILRTLKTPSIKICSMSFIEF